MEDEISVMDEPIHLPAERTIVNIMDKKKIHVLVIPTWYPNGLDKLMGVYHMDFCKAVARGGKCKINMLYIDRQGISMAVDYLKKPKIYIEEQEGYQVYGTRMLDVSRFSYDLQMKLYVKKLISAYKRYEKINGKPDVLHAQVAVPAGWAACVLAEKIGVPVMITEHATYYDSFFEGNKSKYNALVMEKAKITCVGDFMRKFYSEKGVNASVLPNIVECSEFGTARAPRPEGRFNLVTVCALREIKRVDNIIDAVKLLKDKIPSIHYTVIGDGEQEGDFKAHLAASGIEKYVSFVGRKNHSEIAQIFSGMDAAVIASDFETFGIPAVEALAAGIPVVSTRNFGTEGFLDDKCSIMCAVNDVPDLARAIEELYNTYDRFTPEYNKQVAASFDGDRVADMAVEYYKELIK